MSSGFTPECRRQQQLGCSVSKFHVPETGIAANIRKRSRARSGTPFVSELGIVEQDLDASLLWFELLVESDIVSATGLIARQQDAGKFIRTLVAEISWTKSRL